MTDPTPQAREDVLTVEERKTYDHPMSYPARAIIDRLVGRVRAGDLAVETLTPSWVWKLPSKEDPPQVEHPTEAEVEAIRAGGKLWEDHRSHQGGIIGARDAIATLLRALDAARHDIEWWGGLCEKTERECTADVATARRELAEAREEACPGLETCERKDARIRELEAERDEWMRMHSANVADNAEQAARIRELEAALAAVVRERDELLVSERAMGGRLETLVKEVDAQAERREVHPVGTGAELARLRELERRVEDGVGAKEVVDVYAQYGRAGAGMAIAAYRAALRKGGM